MMDLKIEEPGEWVQNTPPVGGLPHSVRRWSSGRLAAEVIEQVGWSVYADTPLVWGIRSVIRRGPEFGEAGRLLADQALKELLS